LHTIFRQAVLNDEPENYCGWITSAAIHSWPALIHERSLHYS
jgi:hypothetical protein